MKGLKLSEHYYREIGGRMQSAYERFPGSFHGFSARNATSYGSDRVGVMDLHEFVRRYIGSEQPPGSLFRWLTLPEEKLAAQFALDEFMKSAIQMIHLLNRRYTPYYKWMYRSLLELPVLKEVSGLIQHLTDPAQPKIQLIEETCRLVAGELERQELIRKTDTYLGIYPPEIILKIQDKELKKPHILVG